MPTDISMFGINSGSLFHLKLKDIFVNLARVI